jgi:hypothetical protein
MFFGNEIANVVREFVQTTISQFNSNEPIVKWFVAVAPLGTLVSAWYTASKYISWTSG